MDGSFVDRKERVERGLSEIAGVVETAVPIHATDGLHLVVAEREIE